jgi:hypothetical protein
MAKLARTLFWIYTAALICIGAAGVFSAEWELTRLYDLELTGLGDMLRATVLNQYRFLKGVEFAFGMYCAVCRDDIFRVLRFNRVFLIGVFGGAGARVFSIFVDGVPHWAFLLFIAIELAAGVCVLWGTRAKLMAS